VLQPPRQHLPTARSPGCRGRNHHGRRRTHKVYVERDITARNCLPPHAIVLSGDGTFAMTAIKYRSYGGAVANATARPTSAAALRTARRQAFPAAGHSAPDRPDPVSRRDDLLAPRYVIHGALPGGDRATAPCWCGARRRRLLTAPPNAHRMALPVSAGEERGELGAAGAAPFS